MLAKWTMSLKGVKRLFAVLVVITILTDIPGVQSVRIGAPQQKLRLKGKSAQLLFFFTKKENKKPNFYILFYTHHLYIHIWYT